MKKFLLLALMVLAPPAFANSIEECAADALARGPFDVTSFEDWANIAILCHKSIGSGAVDCAIEGVQRMKSLDDPSEWTHVAKLCSGADSVEPIDCAEREMRGIDMTKSGSWKKIIQRCAARG